MKRKQKRLSEVQRAIVDECDSVKSLLLEKNKEYGNSALEPINVFSGIAAAGQIKVRIDDKLKRIQTIRRLDELKVHEDTELDLLGYMVLLRVCRRLNKKG